MNARQLVESMVVPTPRGEASKNKIASILEKAPIRALELCAAQSTRIRVLDRNERYASASRALARLGIDVDLWPAPPAGLFVVEERTLYLRDVSPMTVAHEFGHALDCALGGGVYHTGIDPEMRAGFTNADQFVTPYAATGIDEWFAEGFRSFIEVNDQLSHWPKVNRDRLERCAPTLLSFFDERFTQEPAKALERDTAKAARRDSAALTTDVAAKRTRKRATAAEREAVPQLAGPKDEKRAAFYRGITNDIVALIERGGLPEWQKFWTRAAINGLPQNPTTKQPYRGINTIRLALTAAERGYNDSRWMTVKQANSKGWRVRGGEVGTPIEVWKWRDSYFDRDGNKLDEKDAKERLNDPARKDEVQVRRHGMSRTYTVFNAAQIDVVRERDGEKERIALSVAMPLEKPAPAIWEMHDRAERIVKAVGIPVTHTAQDRAFYTPALDRITMPTREQFASSSDYYDVLLHETGHGTGHPSRLNRETLAKIAEKTWYAREELRAELTSFFMAAEIGLPHNVERHAAYLDSWIDSLKRDTSEIFHAARDAQAAHDFMLAKEAELLKELEVTQERAPASLEAAPAREMVASPLMRDEARASAIVANAWRTAVARHANALETAHTSHAADLAVGELYLSFCSTLDVIEKRLGFMAQIRGDDAIRTARHAGELAESGVSDLRERLDDLGSKIRVREREREQALVDRAQDLARITASERHPDAALFAAVARTLPALFDQTIEYGEQSARVRHQLERALPPSEPATARAVRSFIADLQRYTADPSTLRRTRQQNIERPLLSALVMSADEKAQRIGALVDRLCDAGSDRVRVWSIAVNEVRSLNARYDVSTVRRMMVDYRSAVREALGDDHPSVRYLQAYRKDEREIADTSRVRVAERLSQLRAIEPEIIAERAERLMRSEDWASRVAGVAIATGRRVPEIVQSGEFHRVVGDDDALVFYGAVKGGSPVEGRIVSTLADAGLVLGTIEALREQKPLADRTTSQISNSYGKAIAEAAERGLGERFTLTELRDVYATIAYDWNWTPDLSYTSYVANALGHSPTDASTALAHVRFYPAGKEVETCDALERSRLELIASTEAKLAQGEWSPEARTRIEAELHTLRNASFAVRVDDVDREPSVSPLIQQSAGVPNAVAAIGSSRDGAHMQDRSAPALQAQPPHEVTTMRTMQQVSLIGKPATKNIVERDNVTRVGLGQSVPAGKSEGKTQYETKWFDITGFKNDGIAEQLATLSKNLGKDQLLHVVGTVRKDSYDGRDNHKHRITEVFVDRVTVVNKNDVAKQPKNEWQLHAKVLGDVDVAPSGKFATVKVGVDRETTTGKTVTDYFTVAIPGAEKVAAAKEQLVKGESYDFKGAYEVRPSEERDTGAKHKDAQLKCFEFGPDLGVLKTLGVEQSQERATQEPERAAPAATQETGLPKIDTEKYLGRIVDRDNLPYKMEGEIVGQSLDEKKVYMDLGRGDLLAFDKAAFDKVPEHGKTYSFAARDAAGREHFSEMARDDKGQEHNLERGVA